jgi:hypothetical protein
MTNTGHKKTQEHVLYMTNTSHTQMAGESRREHREAGRNGTRAEMDATERGDTVERRVCKRVYRQHLSPASPGQQHEKEPHCTGF